MEALLFTCAHLSGTHSSRLAEPLEGAASALQRASPAAHQHKVELASRTVAGLSFQTGLGF